MKMSPEPTEEPIDNLNTSNINLNIITEVDSDDEHSELAGYMPLSDNAFEGEPLDQDDSEEEFEWDISPLQRVLEINNDAQSIISPETFEIWSVQSNRSNFDLDAAKINLVKTVMASFSLPSTAIPEWANSISEDQWKEQLINRIKEIQQNNNKSS